MYSAVLLMALTGGADAADCHRRDNCGCAGGAVVATCVGAVVAPVGCGYVQDNCGCNGGRGGLFHRHRRNGCNGGCVGYVNGGCVGSVVVPAVGCVGGTVAPPPVMDKKPMPDDKTKKPEPIPVPGKVSLPATLVVNLPAEATLTVDGHVTTSTSTTRVLVTPALPMGQEHSYNLTATVVRDGQTVTQTQRVAVLPGRQTQYSFSFPTATNAVSR